MFRTLFTLVICVSTSPVIAQEATYRAGTRQVQQEALIRAIVEAARSQAKDDVARQIVRIEDELSRLLGDQRLSRGKLPHDIDLRREIVVVDGGRDLERHRDRRVAELNVLRYLVEYPMDRSRRNPPAVPLNGTIERIDHTDSALVRISLGSDHGITKSHTLDAYRLAPEPKYLGTIRIVEAYEHKSIGRLIPAGNATQVPLKVGDKVTSRMK